MQSPQTPTRPLLEPGEVVYAPGWDHCYQVMSGPFCRLHYVRWQGHLAAAPSDPRPYVSYLVRALGGKAVSRVIIKATHFQMGFGHPAGY